MKHGVPKIVNSDPPKLTKNQRSALASIAAGQVSMRNCGYGAWRIWGPPSPVVVGRLIALGLVRWGPAGEGKIASLTDAGCAAHAVSDEGR